MKVFLPESPDSEFARELRGRVSEGVELIFGPSLPEPADFEWLVSGLPSEEALTASPRLRGLVVPWAGLPGRTREQLLGRPELAVHNLHHNAAATAEMALALFLSAAKRVVFADRSLRRGDWAPRYSEAREPLLEGRTAVVLGQGAIGRRVGDACRALGMSIVAVRRSPDRPSDPECVGPEHLRDVLPRADVLFLCLPLTGETRGLLGAEELRLLPDGAVLVNVARGPIVDEESLFRELRSGRISAGLDVWYEYPGAEAERSSTFPSRFPFHELENVVLSPHRAGHTKETERLRAQALADLLRAAARGEPVPNRVDVTLGY